VFVFAEYTPPWPGDEPFSCRALGSPRALQLWIVRGERSLLRMPTATMESRLIVHGDEQLTAFLELERGGLYPPIDRMMLTILVATTESVWLCRPMKS
jgi:hypothetical protein